MKLENFGHLKGSKRISGNSNIIVFEHGTMLQSYDTIVAATLDGILYLAKEHDLSRTTNKHVKDYCGLSVGERRKGLKDGTILPLDL